MAFIKYSFHTELSDFDAHGHFTNSAMLKYLQEAGALHSDAVHMGFYDTAQTGYTWILINWKLEVLARPNWNSTIFVKTWCSKVEKIHTFRDFEVYDEQNQLLAKATSKWILFNIRTNRMERNLERFMDLYQLEESFVFPSIEEKLKEPASYDFRKDFPVFRRDIDTNRHVNNISYLKFAYEVLPEESIFPNDFTSVEIMYKSSTLLGENYAVLVKKEREDFYIVTIKSTDLTALHAIIYLKK